MFDRIRSAFARPSQVPTTEPSGPEAGKLWVEEATNQLVDLLIRIPETDEALTSAGITRASLAKLETDDEIFQALRTRRESVVSTPWRLEGGTDAAKLFLEEELTPWYEVIVGSAWTAVPYGFSVLEVVYAKGPKKIGIADIAQKPIEWFDPRRDGELRYFSPLGMNPQGEVLDQGFKFFLTRVNPTYQQPKGEALLSRLYWPWFFRFNGWKFWGQFLERFGTPLLVGKSSNPSTMIKALIGLHQDAAIAVGKEDDVKVMQPTASGEVFEKLENAIIRRYQRLILGQTLTSDVGAKGGGSFALGKVHAEVKEGLRTSDIRLVTRTFQRVVNALFVLNRLTGDIPQVVLADDTGLEKERSERDRSLKEIGITFTRNYYQERYDLSPNDFLLPGETLDAAGNVVAPQLDTASSNGAVQDTALNGAQVSSLLEIITSVADKQMPVGTAKALISASFPNVAEETIDEMLKGLETFEPRPKAVPQPFGQSKDEKAPDEQGGEEPVVGQKVPSTAPKALKASMRPSDSFERVLSRGSEFTPAQDKLEGLTEGLLTAKTSPISPDLIRSAVLAARSPEDLEKRLAVLMGGADAAQFQRTLEQALYAADVIGYVHAEGKI